MFVGLKFTSNQKHQCLSNNFKKKIWIVFFHFTFYWSQNDGLWSHLSSFISSSAITVSSWRLTAAPLMWKHALRQIYGTVESAAKLSKNIFFMHFHHAQKRQSRWEARFKGSEHTLRRSVTVDWLRCGFKRTSALSRKSVFLLFHASSNRMIYSISTGFRANISSELMTQTAEQPRPTRSDSICTWFFFFLGIL